MNEPSLNAITLSVVQEGLIAIVREMRVNLMRTAFSSVIYESQDYSCALLDSEGQLIAQAEDNPSHIFPMPYSTRCILTKFRETIEPGDVFMVNDPYIGGTHLNDVAIVMPCFSNGTLVAIPAVRAHWGDIGGMRPGSISGSAVDVFQEGLRIPPVRIVRRGVANESFLELLFANVRVPEDRRGDFNAMLSTCQVAQERVRQMIAKHGLATFLACGRHLIEDGERRMKEGIGRLSPGIYYYENYLDSSGATNQPLPVRLRLDVRKDSVTADFSGSALQVRGPTNGGVAVAPTGTFVILKSFIDPATPITEGAFRPITVVAPPGTVTNATAPAACGGFSEVRRAVEAAVLGCLAQAIPDSITGDTKGAANHCTISSIDARTGRQYLFYEYPAGGTGGWRGGDGNSATRIFSEGDFSSIQPIESIEAEHPLLVRRLELREDSCGDGYRRGGLGLRRDIEVLTDGATLSVLSDRNVIPPFGVCGGTAGAPNRFTVERQGTEIQPSEVPGKVSGYPLKVGDVVVMRSSGGGGYGDPLERESRLVLRDFTYSYISMAKAKDVYGLVIDGEAVDEQATEQLRQRKAMERSGQRVRILQTQTDDIVNGLRVFRLSAGTLERLGLEELDLIELVSPRGAPLRGWVKHAEGTQSLDVLPLGPVGCALVGRAVELELRLLRRGAPYVNLTE